MRRECSCVEVCYQKQGAVLGKNWKCRVEAERALYAARAAVPQAPAEPVAQEPVAHRWPFVETPGEIRDRALVWYSDGGYQPDPGQLLAAIRYAIIERGHTLYASPISLPVEVAATRQENADLWEYVFAMEAANIAMDKGAPVDTKRINDAQEKLKQRHADKRNED
jgi:hypothetical protein